MTAPLKRGKLSKVEEFYIEKNYLTKDVDDIAGDLHRSVDIVAKAINKIKQRPKDESDDTEVAELKERIRQLENENDSLRIGNNEQTGTELDRYARNGKGVVTATQVSTTRADESRKKQKLMPSLKGAVQKLR